jgi:hypothetical protein
MKPEEVRTDLAVVEWTLKQWETGALTKLEGGEPITDKHVSVETDCSRRAQWNPMKAAAAKLQE